jgi:hypothetical protein
LNPRQSRGLKDSDVGQKADRRDYHVIFDDMIYPVAAAPRLLDKGISKQFLIGHLMGKSL